MKRMLEKLRPLVFSQTLCIYITRSQTKNGKCMPHVPPHSFYAEETLLIIMTFISSERGLILSILFRMTF